MVGVGGSFACIARDGLSGAENFNPKQRLQRPPVCLEDMGVGADRKGSFGKWEQGKQ